MKLLSRIVVLMCASTLNIIGGNGLSEAASALPTVSGNNPFFTHVTNGYSTADRLFASNTITSTIEFTPPVLTDRDRPRSGNRYGGASRGCAIPGEPSLTNKLIALVPATEASSSKPELSLTTEAYPSFWFHIPYALDDDIALEFVLENEEGNKVYQTKYIFNTDKPGIIKFSLPEMSPPLSIGTSYQWYFSVYCNSSTQTISDHVHGWIARTNISGNLEARLENASTLEKASAYADNGIWQETLTTLGELYRAEPQNNIAKFNWQNLLATIDLQDIAEVPLLECCDTTVSLDLSGN
ncbi:DUF928 domain-containing protein [Leptothoe spongobia]|uniref:DUF928 domain-containing protein n=1 Tax=Leptothoe spongobia TAU-MAC 1115 TaxID=1967444 RepID=A0A947GNV4_9CYAN|nr:DUF928 domain-containing protein [Leptothoe spongobia]MBT9316241.1 DUF928 domain-containing protein [Leptothoe spongobia TAU-MAC 1115]